MVDADGRATVTAHRFRHTVGTQLAERGAKLHTIMSVLGHESPHMSMIYARISDAEVPRLTIRVGAGSGDCWGRRESDPGRSVERRGG